MFNRVLRRILINYAISKASSKPAPDRIPLSGIERLVGRDYYVLWFGTDEDKRRFLFRRKIFGGVSGLSFPEDSNEGEDANLTSEELLTRNITIEQYYRQSQFEYQGVLEFFVYNFFRVYKVVHLKAQISQALFIRGSLALKDRSQLLRFIADETLNDRNYRTSAIDIITEIYSIRAWSHPQRERVQHYYELMLQSLVSSGDLTEHDRSFRLTPKALQTIHDESEEQTRHEDNKRLQRRLVWLTLALVFVGLLDITVRIFSGP